MSMGTARTSSQEAFIRAFRNLDLLVDPSRLAAWLRRIAIGLSIDWLRSFRPDLYGGDGLTPTEW
jgi:DNA-directed RNA polymerase specialized sigma24 family protein